MTGRESALATKHRNSYSMNFLEINTFEPKKFSALILGSLCSHIFIKTFYDINNSKMVSQKNSMWVQLEAL